MYDRREFLTAAGGVALGVGAAGVASGQESDGESLVDWFGNTDGVTSVVDWTGEDRVTITVGARGNGGAFAFDPPVVRVDPGTTVVWRWSGDGGVHNVVAADGSFGSDTMGEAGTTFEHVPESTGVVRYSCTPHESLGMKGALVVGDAAVTLSRGDAGESTGPTGPTFDGWLDGVENYDEVVDARGQDRVDVAVGAAGNGGAFAFDPPAVRVDPGTTVVWEWVGDQGPYSVMDDDLGFASETVDSTDHRYALRFDGSGLSKYYCESYADQGMRGVVLVGDGPKTAFTGESLAAGGGLLALVSAPMVYGLFRHVEDTTRPAPR
ncbi:halocyanin domain-containing protein [Haloarchaeobius sp. HRN-SO-5]|uniref:halocyanin domain-containing protein n=1 Tax=Haloarchaeobius sp. HRN-SO-5 TaxID=3446118 RepID=UPI003EB8E33F